MERVFLTANEAFEYYYYFINRHGHEKAGTKALYNTGFTILKPLDNAITSEMRAWNAEYATAEYLWYTTKTPYIQKLGELYGKVPYNWQRVADEDGFVNSNYGYQIHREDQIAKVVEMLREDPNTRRAAVSIYDGKEIDKYSLDTPCTYAIQFYILDGKLNMSVMMRSNDLWFGFCNDQFCFSMIQLRVANDLGIKVGTYYHFAHDLHLYDQHLDK